MNTISSDPLNAFEKTVLQTTVRELIDDSQLLVSITLKSLTSQVVNVEAGSVARTSDADTVNALRRIVTAEEVAHSAGQLEPEDRVYMVDQADLTKSTLQTVDRITEGTDVLGVRSFSADPLGFVWQIIARIA